MIAHTRPETPYFYLLPMFIVIGTIFIYPIINIFRLSLTSPEGNSFYLGNFKYIFSDSIFWTSLSHNLYLLILVPIITVLALVLALFLFEKTRGWQIHRAIVFFPYVLPIAAIGLVFSYLYQYNGIINSFLRSMGLAWMAKDWIGSQYYVIPTIMTVIVWRETGFGVVLFLARLMSLPQEVLEAAKVDGANWFQRHLYVTLPQLKSIIMFFAVIEAVSMLSWVFSYVYIISGGGPGFSSYVLEIYLWQAAFSLGSPGIASSVAVFLFIFSAVLITLNFKYIISKED